jgi:scyllo-inositol 2-dehydrogenase (NADP+)
VSVRVGILGTGWVAQDRHIPAFRSHPEVELVTVFDRIPERAAPAAERAGVRRWSTNLQEFLASGLDIVSIATPPWTHAELAVAAIESGAHVFTEKPMAMSLPEAESMLAAARAAGRLLCVSHNFQFSRAVVRAKRFLGPEPHLMYAAGVQLSSLRRRLPTWYEDLPGGLLFDEIPHMLYLLQHFLGPLDVDHVRSRRGLGGHQPGSVEVLVTGERGPGQIAMVFDAPVSEWQVVLTSPAGVVALDLFRDIAVRVPPDGAHKPLDILQTSARALADHATGFVASGARYAMGQISWGHDALIGRFVDATLGRGPVPVRADEALGVVRVTDRILAELADDRVAS